MPHEDSAVVLRELGDPHEGRDRCILVRRRHPTFFALVGKGFTLIQEVFRLVTLVYTQLISLFRRLFIYIYWFWEYIYIYICSLYTDVFFHLEVDLCCIVGPFWAPPLF